MTVQKIILSFMLGSCVFSGGCKTRQAFDQVCFKDFCYTVEIADTDASRQRGLQDRARLAEKAGMLFIFSERGFYGFWMKDTLIPLDMIWLDSARRVAHIESNVPPCLSEPCLAYMPLQKAQYVLELNAGRVKAMGLKLGDQLEFRLAAYLAQGWN